MKSGSNMPPQRLPNPAAAQQGARRRSRTAVSARKYLRAFRVSAAQQLAYPGELLARAAVLATMMFVLCSLWRVTYAATSQSHLAGFSARQLLCYLAITESIAMSRPRLSQRLDEEIRSGDVALAMSRPYHFVLFRSAQALGERLTRFAFNLPVALSVVLAFAGVSGFSLGPVLVALPLMACAFLLDFLLAFCIQLLAFWTEDVTALMFMYDRLLLLLGGVLLPVALLPDALAAAARLLPFATIIARPAAAAVGAGGASGDILGLLPIVWLAAAGVLVLRLYRSGMRRLTTNGG